MIRVLFICHGNICRSPMAEFVMKKLVSDANFADHFQIASAATKDRGDLEWHREPGLSAEGGAYQARDLLRREAGPAGDESGLCGI